MSYHVMNFEADRKLKVKAYVQDRVIKVELRGNPDTQLLTLSTRQAEALCDVLDEVLDNVWLEANAEAGSPRG